MLKYDQSYIGVAHNSSSNLDFEVQTSQLITNHSKMKLQSTSTKRNIKNTGLFLFVAACFVSFNVFLHHVHTASINASQRKTTTLRMEFTEGPNTKVTSTSTFVDSSELVTSLATMNAGNCIHQWMHTSPCLVFIQHAQ